MDYSKCNYKGRYVYSAKEYLNAIKAGFFNLAYDPKNRGKMLEEIERIMDYNSSVDIYALAHLLYDEGTESGYDRAYNCLDLIASWDYIPAKYLLGQMYFMGARVDKDLDRFFELTLEASKANYVPAKNALAYAYFNGYGCKVDYAKARKLLQECIDTANYGVAYYNAGIGYLQGSFGYPKDEKKAISYFQEASYQYYKSASYNLGIIYLNGQGCPKNVQKGLQELAAAASLGHLNAQKKLGDAYYFGKITSKNLERAYTYYLMAAENGDAYSMYSVGYMIVKKEYLWVDRYEGIKWLQKASYKGYEAATKLLNDL